MEKTEDEISLIDPSTLINKNGTNIKIGGSYETTSRLNSKNYTNDKSLSSTTTYITDTSFNKQKVNEVISNSAISFNKVESSKPEVKSLTNNNFEIISQVKETEKANVWKDSLNKGGNIDIAIFGKENTNETPILKDKNFVDFTIEKTEKLVFEKVSNDIVESTNSNSDTFSITQPKNTNVKNINLDSNFNDLKNKHGDLKSIGLNESSSIKINNKNKKEISLESDKSKEASSVKSSALIDESIKQHKNNQNNQNNIENLREIKNQKSDLINANQNSLVTHSIAKNFSNENISNTKSDPTEKTMFNNSDESSNTNQIHTISVRVNNNNNIETKTPNQIIKSSDKDETEKVLNQIEAVSINDNVNFNKERLNFIYGKQKTEDILKDGSSQVSLEQSCSNEINIDDFIQSDSKLNLGDIKGKKTFSGDRNFMLSKGQQNFSDIKSKIDNSIKVSKEVKENIESSNDELAKKFEEIQNEKNEKLKDYRDIILKMKKDKRSVEKNKVESDPQDNQLSEDVKKRLEMRKSLADKLKK